MASYIDKVNKLTQIKHRLHEIVYERDKKAAKKMAEELQIPFVKNLAENINLVLKKNTPNNNKNITIIKSGDIYFYNNYDIIEELVIDATGQVPPRNFQIYVFNHIPKLIEIYNPLYYQYAYYDLDWNFLNGITTETRLTEHTKPKHFYRMVDIASGLSRKFNFPVRIDCYCTHEEVFFADCCLTPRIINTLTDRGDDMLGKAWHDHFMRKGIKDEFSVKERPYVFQPYCHIKFS